MDLLIVSAIRKAQETKMIIYDIIKDIIIPFISGFIVPIVLGVVGYLYDRGTRYNYLADRWNDLMNINVDKPDFFNPERTKNYDSCFDKDKKTIYNQHARMHWGFVEDVIRNDHWYDLPGLERYVDAYRDTIKECIQLHHVWLKNNNENLFTYPKFRKVLKKKFWCEL